jgi:hypothetical protein
MNHRLISKISLYSATFVAVVLLLAALAKWLFPFPLPYYLDRISIFVEIFIAILILIFNRRSEAWSVLSLLISIWVGYSLFWLLQNSSCGCFGAFEGVTTGVAVGLDLLMIALSWINMTLLGSQKRAILATICFSVLAAIAGFWLSTLLFYVPSSAHAPEKPSNLTAPASPSTSLPENKKD